MGAGGGGARGLRAPKRASREHQHGIRVWLVGRSGGRRRCLRGPSRGALAPPGAGGCRDAAPRSASRPVTAARPLAAPAPFASSPSAAHVLQQRPLEEAAVAPRHNGRCISPTHRKQTARRMRITLFDPARMLALKPCWRGCKSTLERVRCWVFTSTLDVDVN